MDDLLGLDFNASSKPSGQGAPAASRGTGNYYVSSTPALTPTPPPGAGQRLPTPLSSTSSPRPFNQAGPGRATGYNYTSSSATPPLPTSGAGPRIPTPPSSSSRSHTPSFTTNTNSKSNSKPTAGTDSFADLLSFGAKKESVSLREQQERREREQREKREEERKKEARMWGGVGDTSGGGGLGGTGFGGSRNPFTSAPPPGKAAPVVERRADKEKGFGGLGVNDDDPFGLGGIQAKAQVKGKAPAHSPQPLADDDPFELGNTQPKPSAIAPAYSPQPLGDEDDFLGDLGKPVEEVRKQRQPTPPQKPARPASPPSRESSTGDGGTDPWDKAVAELVDMGFTASKARQALTESGQGLNVQAAVGWLLDEAHQKAKQAKQPLQQQQSQQRRQQGGQQSAQRQQSPPRQSGLTEEAMALEARDESRGRREKATPILKPLSGLLFGGWSSKSPATQSRRESPLSRPSSSKPSTPPLPVRPKQPATQNRRESPASSPSSSKPSAPLPTRPKTSAPPSRKESPATRPPPSKPSTPIPVRPQAPPRSIPPLSPSALAQSTQHRKAGTEHLQRGDYASAHTSFTSSLSSIPDSHPFAIILLCQRALTGLKTGDPKSAVSDADAAISIMGPSRGVGETIDLQDGTGKKEDMKDFYGQALVAKAEALEQMERWRDAEQTWRAAVEVGAGGAVAIQGRQRCERALAPKPKPKPKPVTAMKPAAASLMQGQDSEAVLRMREANAAAEAADDEKFALGDAVDAKISAWRAGRQDNLRALLGALDQVLWEGSGWRKVGMHELVGTGKVKVFYMKAIGRTHPDKVSKGRGWGGWMEMDGWLTRKHSYRRMRAQRSR